MLDNPVAPSVTLGDASNTVVRDWEIIASRVCLNSTVTDETALCLCHNNLPFIEVLGVKKCGPSIHSRGFRLNP